MLIRENKIEFQETVQVFWDITVHFPQDKIASVVARL